ncbi:hypothetical protein ABIA06_003011 [Bradyrhizobium yuanmingense]
MQAFESGRCTDSAPEPAPLLTLPVFAVIDLKAGRERSANKYRSINLHGKSMTAERSYHQATSSVRRILKKGTFNARDAGGYPVMDGKWLLEKRIYRSDASNALTPGRGVDIVIVEVQSGGGEPLCLFRAQHAEGDACFHAQTLHRTDYIADPI